MKRSFLYQYPVAMTLNLNKLEIKHLLSRNSKIQGYLMTSKVVSGSYEHVHTKHFLLASGLITSCLHRKQPYFIVSREDFGQKKNSIILAEKLIVRITLLPFYKPDVSCTWVSPAPDTISELHPTTTFRM